MAIGKSARKESPIEPVTTTSGKTLLPNGTILDANGQVISGAVGGGQFGAPMVDPNSGIGMGSFGPTWQEIERQRALTGTDYVQLQAQQDQIHNRAKAMVDKWVAENPQQQGRFGLPAELQAIGALQNNPEYQALLAQQRQVSQQMQAIGPMDMSDPGRFAAMSEAAQGRAGITLDRYGIDKTAAPDVVNMQRTAAPDIYEMQRQNAPLLHDMRQFQAQQFDIDPLAGQQDYQNAQQVRAKNLEVMGGVQDRAMGRGGPSVAELQMKQGQDRAISAQAALAASGGQMDYAQARRQAMMNAADIQQKTASDTGILRANEQIAAQNTFGSLASAQQSADLSARGQTMGQANARSQFLSDQALRNAQFQAQQEQAAVASRVQQGQFGAQFGLSQEQAIAQSMAQQRQFGAQFGLNQEQMLAQQAIQQGQFNAQFGSSQDQWAAQFQAQQALNQGNLTMQQRQQNDQYQQMLLNQYMASRGMQQQNAWHNQAADLQMAGIKNNMNIASMQDAQVRDAAARQQQTAMISGVATTAAGMMAQNQGGGGGYFGGNATPRQQPVMNSGFNQSDPKKIDWGY